MKTEDCREWRESLGAYALGHLAGDERAGLEAHLEGCAECRAEAASLARRRRAAAARRPGALRAGAPARRRARPTGSRPRSPPSAAPRRRRRRLRLGFGARRRGRRGGGDRRLFVLPGGGSGARRSTSSFASLPEGMKIDATLEPHSFGTEIHMYVQGVRSGTLCRVFLRGADGGRSGRHLPLPLGRRLRRRAQLGARPLPRRAIGVHAGGRTFVAPVAGTTNDLASVWPIERGGRHDVMKGKIYAVGTCSPIGSDGA